MARLTFQQVIARIQRMPGLGRIGMGEIIEAIQTASKDLGNQPWPWNYAETNIAIPAVYTTGTVTVTIGSATVTGAATTWDPTWYGRRIAFGNSNLDYIVSSIGGVGTLTLDQPYQGASNLTNVTYSMWQDTYLYPSDYIIASDTALLDAELRTRVRKIPRYRFEQLMNAGYRRMFSSIALFYCDHGEDLSAGNYGAYRFRLGPPLSGAKELRLCYHRMAPDLANPTDKTMLPEGFDELLPLVAAAKLYDMDKERGSSFEVKALAAGKIKLLKRQVATQTIDDLPEPTSEIPDSSMSQWGLMIERMS